MRKLSIGSILTAGARSISGTEILSRVRSRVGELFDPAVAAQDAKRIAELGGVEYSYYNTSVVDNKIKLTFVVVEKNIVLETCPTSNMNTKLIKSFDQMRHIYATLLANKVPFTINTDGPEMQQISLRKEFEKLLKEKILTPEEMLHANRIATKASFIK